MQHRKALARSFIVFIKDCLIGHESSYRLEGAIKKVIAEYKFEAKQQLYRSWIQTPGDAYHRVKRQLYDSGDLLLESFSNIDTLPFYDELFRALETDELVDAPETEELVHSPATEELFDTPKTDEMFDAPETAINQDIEDWQKEFDNGRIVKAQAIEASAKTWPHSFYIVDHGKCIQDHMYDVEVSEDAAIVAAWRARTRAGSATECPQSWKPRFSRFGYTILPSKI